jgi:hypothetical protein
MAYEPQDVFQARNIVIGPKKQTTYGTALLDASLTQRIRMDGGAFAQITKEFHNDLDRSGKGHPFATEHTEIQRRSQFGGSFFVDDFLAAWACIFCMGKVVTSGAGPFTHTITFENATNIAPVTGIYFEDTADIKFKLNDLWITELEFSGAEKGAIGCTFSAIGSGKHTDGAHGSLPAIATQTYFFGHASDILLGPVGAAVSIKERVRAWSFKISVPVMPHYAPGGGLFSSFHKMGPQRVTLSLQVGAKDVDDIRTLFLNDTLREVQILNTNGANQFNSVFKGVYFNAAQLGVDGSEEVWSLESDEASVIKNGANEILTVTCINGVAAYQGVG